jgi:hypothetical protein
MTTPPSSSGASAHKLEHYCEERDYLGAPQLQTLNLTAVRVDRVQLEETFCNVKSDGNWHGSLLVGDEAPMMPRRAREASMPSSVKRFFMPVLPSENGLY